MKNAEKLASILLALVMILATAVPAFAETQTGTITVTNAIAGTEYQVYKVFDLTYLSGDPMKVAYSYTKTGEADGLYSALTGTGSPFSLESTTVTDVYNVSVKEGKTTPDIVQFLTSLVENNTLTTSIPAQTPADGTKTVKFSDLPLGYYYVSSSLGAVITLTSTLPDAEVVDKNEIKFEKTDDAESVEIGQTVNYTIDGNVPDWTGFETYTYEIADTMSAGLAFQKNVTVKVGDGDPLPLSDGTNNPDSKHTITYNDDGFTLRIDVKELGEDSIGKAIQVTYTAVVNDKAVSVISANTATLTYSNDSKEPTSTKKLTVKQTVYTAKIVIDKYETGKDTIKLQGADFILYKEKDGQKLYYQYTAATDTAAAKVEWVGTQGKATVMTTDGAGAASFTGLADGSYFLLETKAPSGYNLLPAPVSVTINGADATAENLGPLDVTKVVENSTGPEMPSTGGIGTTIFYIAGGILLIGAGVLLVVRKRMSTAKKFNK